MKRQFLISGVVLVAVAGLVTAAYATHSWGGYHWARQANPFTLKVGDNVSSAWDQYLDEAISDWNPSSVLDLTKIAGGTNPKNCRAVAGTIQACNSKYGNNGWLGLAQIWITGGVHITQATTKVNDTYFNTPTYNTPAWRRLVMCQEIAHDFGLDHQDEGFGAPNLGTCMDYTNDPDGGGAYGPSNEHPNLHDFEELETIYAHTDSTTTVGQSAPSNGKPQDVGDEPGSWGREIRRSENGHASVFERDFGRGNKVITHVFWAEPRGK